MDKPFLKCSDTSVKKYDNYANYFYMAREKSYLKKKKKSCQPEFEDQGKSTLIKAKKIDKQQENTKAFPYIFEILPVLSRISLHQRCSKVNLAEYLPGK